MEKSKHTLSVSLRPRSFGEMIGQKSVVQAVQKQLASDRQPVAWMFVGPPGVGKTTLALILAHAVQGSDTGTPEIDNRNAADLNGVEDARQLVELSGYAPFSGKKRVVILDEAQQLTGPAQNVLLKAFENENSPTVWVICTTDPHKIIKPLRDRCLTFTLQGLSTKERDELVSKAWEEATGAKEIDPAFIAELNEQGVNSPRQILQSVERLASGMEPHDAVAAEDPARADFKQIVREVMNGNWGVVRGLLSAVPNSDSLALRGYVAASIAYALLRATKASEADAYYRCLAEAAKFTQGFQDGTTAPFTKAWLYAVCRLIKKEKTK